MHEAILHIGTEKTGSTAIQNYLYKNATELAKNYGVYFPFRSCGLISNYRLILYTKAEIDTNLARLLNQNSEFAIHDDQSYAEWKKRFSIEHSEAVKRFQQYRINSLVVYSSEHFHSRVQDKNEIYNLKKYLSTLYDKITIIFYARRQDQLALSAYNTAVQGGRCADFDFSTVTTSGPYYDYLALAERWSNVFGANNVKPIIYDSAMLRQGDVVKDFESQIGLHICQPNKDKIKYHKSNERLSYTAMKVLIEFNLMEDTDNRLQGLEKNAIRQDLIRELHSLKDDYGKILPARSEVTEFYKHYIARNEKFARIWLKGKRFSDNFSAYPEHAKKLPEIDSNAILTTILNQYAVKCAS